MSGLLRTLAPLRSSSRTLARPAASFHTSTARFALSEAERDAHADNPGRDAKIDHHKHDSVNKAKAGSGEWKPELASQSEQSVKGEKHDLSMEEMQKLGEQKAEQGQTPSGSDSSKTSP